MAKPRKASQLLDWYHRERPVFDGLASTAESILRNLIKKEGVSVVSVSSRVKTGDSLVEKLKRKRYRNPVCEITDFVGLRVITYTEDDASRVCAIVKGAFTVDLKNSVDKSSELEVDQIGYRSYHYVCDLGPKRIALPEFEAFAGKCFEVQVRTVLQHAWAEVEHDRNYKFSGILPSELRRRLFLISGLLEIGDRELNSLSRDIDAYVASVKDKAASGELLDELNSATLGALVPQLSKRMPKIKISVTSESDAVKPLIEECAAFGIRTTSDLMALITDEFVVASEQAVACTSEVGMLRDAMMWADLHRYFRDAWKAHWLFTNFEAVEVLKKKYPEEEVRRVFAENSITIEEEFDYADYDLGDDGS